MAKPKTEAPTVELPPATIEAPEAPTPASVGIVDEIVLDAPLAPVLTHTEAVVQYVPDASGITRTDW